MELNHKLLAEFRQSIDPFELNRFRRKIDVQGDCWVWTASKSTPGYGAFRVKGITIGAHHFLLSSEQRRSISEEGLVAMHSCDNRACVNPAHISVGTPQENTHDMMKKGRGRTRAKPLTPEQVEEIRALPKDHIKLKALAKKFGVIPEILHSIRRGRTYKT